MCHYVQDRPISAWTGFVIFICTVLTLLLLLGTAYDIWLGFRRKKDPSQSWLAPNVPIQRNPEIYQPGCLGQLMLCFSIPRNMGNILNRDAPNSDDDELVFINGAKTFTLLWVIIINIFLTVKDRPWGNYAGFLEDLHTLPMHLIINGRFVADTLFCISGFLASSLILKELSRPQNSFNTFYYYFHRYWRVLPTYMMTMLLASGIFYYTQDGPKWMESNEYQSNCGQHWWKALLMINNFFSGTESCPPFSWYFATDFQLHLMAPLIIYPLYKSPQIGIALLSIVAICFMSIAPLVTGIKKLPYFVGRLFYLDPHHDDFTDLILTKPWAHAAPFLMGILFGYLLYKRDNNAKTKTHCVIFGWVLSTSAILTILFGFYSYIDGQQDMPLVLGILYTTVSPTIWAASIGWILYACATKQGGIVNHIYSWQCFGPFGRICFSSYLVNGLVINHFFDSRADDFYYDGWMMTVVILGITFITGVSAVILSTTVERPFLELEKVCFGYQRGKKTHSFIQLNSDDESEEEDDDDEILCVDVAKLAGNQSVQSNKETFFGKNITLAKGDSNLLKSTKEIPDVQLSQPNGKT